MKKISILLPLLLICLTAASQPSGRIPWNDGWTFSKDGTERVLSLPHDWGVEGPFRQEYPGETGKLAWWGEARYSKDLQVGEKELKGTVSLEVDGALSHAVVSVNGRQAGGWPYGYASWAVDLTPFLSPGNNRIEIKLDNQPESSRWYPGGGIYRNVWLRYAAATAVSHWGTYITSDIREGKATVRQQLTIHSKRPGKVLVKTRIYFEGRVVAQAENEAQVADGGVIPQVFEIDAPHLWTPETPALYCARTTVEAEDSGGETYETPFGIREAAFRPDGFYLNGKKTFLKGVCLHHDAGALGAYFLFHFHYHFPVFVLFHLCLDLYYLNLNFFQNQKHFGLCF